MSELDHIFFKRQKVIRITRQLFKVLIINDELTAVTNG